MAYNKEVQSAYKKKLKQFKVQYNLQDNIEGLRVQKFLDDNNLTANSYIKELLKKDMDDRGIPYKEEYGD